MHTQHVHNVHAHMHVLTHTHRTLQYTYYTSTSTRDMYIHAEYMCIHVCTCRNTCIHIHCVYMCVYLNVCACVNMYMSILHCRLCGLSISWYDEANSYLWFGWFWSVRSPHDCHTILLAYPTQVRHRLHHSDVWNKLTPERAECGVGSSSQRYLTGIHYHGCWLVGAQRCWGTPSTGHTGKVMLQEHHWDIERGAEENLHCWWSAPRSACWLLFTTCIPGHRKHFSFDMAQLTPSRWHSWAL